jgi:hypothetical protein
MSCLESGNTNSGSYISTLALRKVDIIEAAVEGSCRIIYYYYYYVCLAIMAQVR